jgi:hypothetical protein
MADRGDALFDIDRKRRRLTLGLLMDNELPSNGDTRTSEGLKRRLFLKSVGKWSGAAILATLTGTAWLASSPAANAGWLNRRGIVRGGGWINRGGGGGWINRRVGGGGGWINRW